MSMLAALKNAEKQAPTNIVNADITVVEVIDGQTVVVRDTTPPPSSQRPVFKPVDRSVKGLAAAIARGETAPSDNFDLVGDDIGASPQQKKRAANAGRQRLYANSAARQQAYRDRKKTGA